MNIRINNTGRLINLSADNLIDYSDTTLLYMLSEFVSQYNDYVDTQDRYQDKALFCFKQEDKNE